MAILTGLNGYFLAVLICIFLIIALWGTFTTVFLFFSFQTVWLKFTSLNWLLKSWPYLNFFFPDLPWGISWRQVLFPALQDFWRQVQFSCSVMSNSLWLHELQHHLVLCHPLLLLPSVFPSIRVFSKWVSSLHQVAKGLELQRQSFQWIFSVDFL